jgi:hypothetical protein
MRSPGDAGLLTLWERGVTLHPLDRAVLLCAWARDDVPPALLADLPLGVVNRTLLRLRRAWFGPHLAACTECPRCGEQLEFTLDVDELVKAAPEPAIGGEAAFGGFRLRAPTLRDLAAVADAGDEQSAALRLLDRCCVARPDIAAGLLEPWIEEAERQLETLDPSADLGLALICDVCGHRWSAILDVSALLWTEIARRAATVLSEVHRLAFAYGWSERDILALSPQRRAAYLELGAV